MAWVQLETNLGARESDSIEILLEELGAVAITLKDAGNHPLLEPALGETPMWPTIILTALFPEDISEASLINALSDHFRPNQLKFTHIQDQNWQANFEHSLKPRCFGRRLWVMPDSNEPRPTNSVAITLSPGLAFGSGEHPTTAMCLNWLDSLDLHNAQVLDFGCGSGVLGLAAAALGAKSVLMTDIDPQALTAARKNTEKNKLQDKVHIELAARIGGSVQYDTLLANILSGTLIELGPNLNRLMRPGARMAITGILASQAEQVCTAWSGWANMSIGNQINEWVLLTGTKQGKLKEYSKD
ncbi:MAG: 50S ribosomal protein L11 methyltransferase [Gammaproteobacteria bacterium]|nr:50S ribosomal protein L11 methyltransferase [Gammaproteobacteria bacterium]MCP4276118.1 50S ribosomal protein L11 methyltransferase [Gammaproteobacteria bacterium]MCP4830862.1 50S ribosomal protein L11 methyltransferase [Gammaproteobacteria bacterium]MCP4929688.1 50S ribosomal protein L11 methyltransferase [Gammaproteobacteria bacterium]